jgi:hypothetical protein
MKKFCMIGLTLLALLVLGAVSSASALAAEPEALFLTGTSTTFTATSGKGHLSTRGVPISIECAQSKSSGEVKAKTGTISIDFELCTLLGKACWSLGDTTDRTAGGLILTGGPFKLVYDSLSTERAGLLPALLFEPGELHIECEALSELLLVKGSILLLFSSLTSGTEVTSAELITKVTSGKPADTKYWTSSGGTELHPLLLTSVSGGTFEESGDESVENKATYAAMVGADF